MKTCLRLGRVFINESQNDDKKTTVRVYSLRAKNAPPISTPLKWREVEEALVFEGGDVLKRVKKWGDLFTTVRTMKQKRPV